jgi:hypothetical protein
MTSIKNIPKTSTRRGDGRRRSKGWKRSEIWEKYMGQILSEMALDSIRLVRQVRDLAD